MRAFLVTHTHWDREWYRTYQEFRARLVDAVDRVTRSRERSELALRTELRVDPCSSSVDVRVQLDNTAEDHRLRLLFPVGRQNR